MIILSKSETETSNVARKIASEIKAGDVLALKGDLGSGKTTFAKHFAKELGVREEITSPTYVIMKSYDFVRNNQNLKLVHIDAYRLEQTADAEMIGLTEIMNDKKNIVVIEWPEKVWSLIQKSAIEIDFEYIDEATRKISVK